MRNRYIIALGAIVLIGGFAAGIYAADSITLTAPIPPAVPPAAVTESINVVQYSWMLPAATALAVIIGAITTALISWSTRKAVDGKMTEMVRIITEKVTAEVQLKERINATAREALDALAVKRSVEGAAVTAAANVVPIVPANAQAILDAAALTARQLLESAAVIAAAKLITDSTAGTGSLSAHDVHIDAQTATVATKQRSTDGPST